MAKAKPQTRAEAAQKRQRLVAKRTGSDRKPTPGEALARAVKLFGKPWRAPVVVETTPPSSGEGLGVKGGSTPPSAGEGGARFDRKARSKESPRPTEKKLNDRKAAPDDSTSKEIEVGVARIGAKPAHDHAAIPLTEKAPRGPYAGGIWSIDGAAERLKQRWTNDGLSASGIAADLTAFTGRPVSRSAVMSKIRCLGLTGQGQRKPSSGKPKVAAAKAAPATKPEKRADLSTGAEPDEMSKTSPSPPTVKRLIRQMKNGQVVQSEANLAELVQSAPTIAAEEINTRPEPDVVALFGLPRAERVAREPGTYRITDLRPEQCRYIAGDDHLCCGAPAPIGPGNLHGSWCPAHRARVFTENVRPGRPSVVKHWSLR